MSETERLKKELEEIKQELATLKEGSRAYKALEDEKAKLEAQLTGFVPIAQVRFVGIKAQQSEWVSS